MKIIWSPLSIEKLEQITDYISQDNIDAANELANKILNDAEKLKDFPMMGREVPEVHREEIREIFVEEYRVIYKIEKNKISILTIRNFKQKLPNDEIS